MITSGPDQSDETLGCFDKWLHEREHAEVQASFIARENAETMKRRIARSLAVSYSAGQQLLIGLPGFDELFREKFAKDSARLRGFGLDSSWESLLPTMRQDPTLAAAVAEAVLKLGQKLRMPEAAFQASTWHESATRMTSAPTVREIEMSVRDAADARSAPSLAAQFGVMTNTQIKNEMRG